MEAQKSSFEKAVEEYLKQDGVNKTPIPYIDIKRKMQTWFETGEPILVEDSSFPSSSSTKIYINYVGDRWVGGYSEVLYLGSIVKVPETIHYSDLYTTNPTIKKRIVPVKDNPYEV